MKLQKQITQKKKDYKKETDESKALKSDNANKQKTQPSKTDTDNHTAVKSNNEHDNTFDFKIENDSVSQPEKTDTANDDDVDNLFETRDALSEKPDDVNNVDNSSMQEINQIVNDVSIETPQVEPLKTNNELIPEKIDSSNAAAVKEKIHERCQTAEACVERIKDPNNTTSLHQTFQDMKELMTTDAFKKYTSAQQSSIKFFAENGDDLLAKKQTNKLSSWDKMNIGKNAYNLPKEKNGIPIDKNALKSKLKNEQERIKSEKGS